MTDKEAIEYGYRHLNECIWKITDTNEYALIYVLEKRKEFISRSISALQEREERSNPTKSWIKYSCDEWVCPYCGYDKYCDTLDGGVLPPFCEECGRPLKGVDNGS